MRNQLTKCLATQERAKKRIPGMTQLLSKRPDMFSLGVWPGYFDKAWGVNVQDLDGNRYIDMSISGIGANVLGYRDPDVDRAVREAITKGNSCSLNCPEEVELADALCSLHPWADMVRYAKTGGEAMAVAVRIARAHAGRDEIAFCGYHGWHDWYLAVNLGTENALGEHLLPGLSPVGVPKGLTGTMHPFRYNHLDELEDIFARRGPHVAAVVMEPIRSSAPDPGFLAAVKKMAKKNGSVLVIDEISAGFRLCAGGAHLTLGLNPDMAVFSKALGNGYPIAAIIGKEDVMQAAQKTFISSTYWTERIGPAAALAVIKKFGEENVADHLIAMGTMVQEGWKSAAAKYDLDMEVAGIAPASHFVFNYENALAMKAYYIQAMLDRGFLASNLFYATYAHKEVHVKKYLRAVDKIFAELAVLVAQGKVEEKLEGLPSTAGFKRLT